MRRPGPPFPQNGPECFSTLRPKGVPFLKKGANLFLRHRHKNMKKEAAESFRSLFFIFA